MIDELSLAGRMGDLEEYYGAVGSNSIECPTEFAACVLDVFNTGSKTFFADKGNMPFFSMYIEKSKDVEKIEETMKELKETFDTEISNADLRPIINRMRVQNKDTAQLTFKDLKSLRCELFSYDKDNITMRFTSRNSFSISYEDYTVMKTEKVPKVETRIVNKEALNQMLTELEELRNKKQISNKNIEIQNTR